MLFYLTIFFSKKKKIQIFFLTDNLSVISQLMVLQLLKTNCKVFIFPIKTHVSFPKFFGQNFFRRNVFFAKSKVEVHLVTPSLKNFKKSGSNYQKQINIFERKYFSNANCEILHVQFFFYFCLQKMQFG